MYKLSIIFFLCLPLLSVGQELYCTVTVNSDKVQTTDKAVFIDMEKAFAQFLNTRKWTNDKFQPHERIKCNLNIIINSSPSLGQYSASIQIQSARPIYNSNYESILFNFADRDWEFDYIESQPLDFSEVAYMSNLTSMLGFYAYIILGLDYDSFSDLGGTQFYQKALNVVNNAQQSNRHGWDSKDNNQRNRYWLIENLTNKRMEPIRKGLYTYHRLAMDAFHDNQDESRKKIISVLQDLKNIKKQSPSAILVISFMDTKAAELVNIYSEGDIQIRRQAYNLLIEISPSRRSEFNAILQ
ncbi:MAG: DUF4835 family protein [Cyclobacteriaceae bacterium]|nr:DUF4835 family protein [Cyclobacteriaceae bacterium]